MVQLMANRGYAVLQLNFRGSTGYGDAWRKAAHQAWGTVMHEDITAGAHWLVSQGIADPGTHVHRRLELWRLRGPDRRGEGTAPVPLCREHRRRLGHVAAGR